MTLDVPAAAALATAAWTGSGSPLDPLPDDLHLHGLTAVPLEVGVAAFAPHPCPEPPSRRAGHEPVLELVLPDAVRPRRAERAPLVPEEDLQVHHDSPLVDRLPEQAAGED